jgi:Rab5 GDP/GTP exchange factor
MNTLMQIFPTADREVVEMVLEACDGDVGVALERLLEMMGS